MESEASERTELNADAWQFDATDLKVICDRHNLNGMQKKALQDSLVKRLLIVQGPPGTGKTHLLTAACVAHQELRRKLYLSAPSNLGVLNLIERAETKDIHVVVVASELNKKLPQRMLDKSIARLASEAEGSGHTKSVKKRRAEYRLKLLTEADALVGTCQSGGSVYLQHDFPACIQSLIVDEAGQASEPDTLAPMMHLSSDAHVLLVGLSLIHI